MNTTGLNNEIGQYSQWREEVSSSLEELARFLKATNITDLRSHHIFESILGSLSDDSLTVAFVAEFSRGKSEMINTIFFGNYAKRILPSGIGRTTMCPVELRYDPNLPTSIRLLPIETRQDETPVYALKLDQSAWIETQFDEDDIDSMIAAFKSMTDSKLVSRNYAEKLNFSLLDKTDNIDDETGLPVNQYDEVEIPTWRHAVVNLPHPLLEQGLVILDTPGLNAIGAEPELTINQIASAHTAVFILATDTGVTKTDLDLWQSHLHEATQESCLVAMNKIDTLWDGIREDSDIEREIAQQVTNIAETLELPETNIFPVSAQKGLLGKAKNDDVILQKSQIQNLEHAIGNKLIPAKKQIVSNKVQSQLTDILGIAHQAFGKRCADVDEHINELQQLSDKNLDVITHIMEKAKSEKTSLETDMNRYQALQTVYKKQTNKLMNSLSGDRLERLIAKTKHNMTRCATSITLQRTISHFFEKTHRYIDSAIAQAQEISDLTEKVGQEFAHEHGIKDFKVRMLKLEKYKQEIYRLERKHSNLQETKTLFFKEQMSITNKFYESVCIKTRRIFKRAQNNATDWKNNLMIPMETHVREHHAMLRRRLESVKRIHRATDTVEQRLKELEAVQKQTQEQRKQFERLKQKIDSLFEQATEADSSDDTQQQAEADVIYLNANIAFPPG